MSENYWGKNPVELYHAITRELRTQSWYYQIERPIGR
jgi:hypothetical protein